MKYKINRIERIDDGRSSFEQCSVIVSDLEAFRKSICSDEVHFVYETIR